MDVWYFFIKDGILYETIDGCRKQYIFTDSIWILSVLDFTYRGILDRFINSPVCGRIKIYGINISDKS